MSWGALLHCAQLLLACFVFSGSASALDAPFALHAQGDGIRGLPLSLLLAPAGELELGALASMPANAFRELKPGEPVCSALGSAWLRLPIRNGDAQESRWMLSLAGDFSTHALEFALLREDGSVERGVSGIDARGLGGSLRGRARGAEFSLAPGGEAVALLRVRAGYEEVRNHFVLQTQAEYLLAEARTNVFAGVFLGVLLLSTVANLAQALAFRDRAFRWYALFCAVMLFDGAAYYGVYSLLGFAPPWVDAAIIYAIGDGIACVSALRFTRALFQMRHNLPRLDRLLAVLEWIAVGVMIARLAAPRSVSGRDLQACFALALAPLVVAVGWRAWRKGLPSARIYLFAWGCLAAGVVIVSLGDAGALPVTWFVHQSYLIGQMLETCALNLVMFHRGRALRDAMERLGAERAQRERLDCMLRVIAHDLANPLQVVLHQAQRGRGRAAGGSAEGVMFERIERAAAAQQRILAGARCAMKLFDSGGDAQLRAVPVAPLLAELDLMFSERAAAKGIALRLESGGAEDAAALADPVALAHSVLANVLSNALKFTSPGGSVVLRCRADPDYVEFEVVDEGVGMSREQRTQLFERENALPQRGTAGEAGSGFGLRIVKSYVALFGGRLDIGAGRVSPDGTESGTAVRIRLARVPAPAEAPGA